MTTMSRPRRALGALLAAGALATGGLALDAPAHAAATACADVDVVIARGTGEPGTYGWVVGDTVKQGLEKKLKGKRTASYYAVPYPASLDAGSPTAGNKALVAHVVAQAAACPNQVFVLSGYSQGANVVDMSLGIPTTGSVVSEPIAATLPASVEPRIKAILQFGNPIRTVGPGITGVYAARTADFCRSGDPVCQKDGGNVAAHLLYFLDTDAATTFAAQRL